MDTKDIAVCVGRVVKWRNQVLEGAASLFVCGSCMSYNLPPLPFAAVIVEAKKGLWNRNIHSVLTS